MAEVPAKLEGVVPERVGHVAHPLKFVLLLIERAIALVLSQRIPKSKGGAPQLIDSDAGHAGCVSVTKVQFRYTGILRRRGSHAIGIDKHTITEVSEAEVRHPVVVDHVSGPIGEALVPECRGTGKVRIWELRSAGQCSEGSRSALRHLKEAIAPEHIELLGEVSVQPRIEGICVDDAGSVGDVVRSSASRTRDVRQRNELQ